SDGERQDGGGREGGRATERSPTEAHVLRDIGDVLAAILRRLPACVVGNQTLPHALDVTVAGQGVGARALRCHAEREVALLAHRDVELELLVHVRGDVATQESQVACPAAAPAGHAIAGAARSTRVTACEYFSHTVASFRRCFRPAAVIV